VLRLLPFVFLVFSAASRAEQVGTSECTLDAASYQTEAKALAAKKPGATLNPETFEVSWYENGLGRVSVHIGGCNHLGFSARLEQRSVKPMSQKQVMKSVSRLLNKLWPKVHANAIISALPRLERIESDPDWNSYSSSSIDGYDIVNLSYRFRSGVTIIEISVIQTV
jgi:hypothetical protein